MNLLWGWVGMEEKRMGTGGDVNETCGDRWGMGVISVSVQVFSGK